MKNVLWAPLFPLCKHINLGKKKKINKIKKAKVLLIPSGGEFQSLREPP